MADTGTLVAQHQPPQLGGSFIYGVRAMPPQRLFTLLTGFALIIAVLVGIFLWSRTPDYRVLYANLSDRDGGAVVQALQQMKVPYKFSEGGGIIYVPSDKVHDVRLRLASQGLPRGGAVGFELLENQKFGLTQFQEQVNYQRALEGELSRSVQSLSAVQSARVHLAIPKPSVFLREQQKPSASVLLNLYAGRTLSREQIAGITHLVSSSVPELPTTSVSVVDQNGNLLSSDGNPRMQGELDEQQLAYRHQVEASYIQRITDILEPVVGRDNLRVQVTADLDFSQTEATAEIYKPNQNPAEAAIRSQQTQESVNGSQTAGGVPGALTNQPAPAATAPITDAPEEGASANTTQANLNTHRESVTNYEIDKTVRHTRTPTGTINRLSAAVVVNYRRALEPAPASAPGQAAAKPVEKLEALSAEELAKIEALVKEAMGYTAARGDSLNVANVPFTVPEAAPAPVEPPVWKQPQYIELAKDVGKNLLIGALVLIVLFGFVRPLIRTARNSMTVAPAPAQLTAAPQAAAASYEERLQSTRELARSDPKMVASVVRNWVAQDD
ncbi:MAG TPA: flagellar basal-body MS-ring/collar protein FliF [Burkholderiales bacterium]|nr:flagellar basal-body MS-ring/collar protein FliF [Burkholderiales bacterium]